MREPVRSAGIGRAGVIREVVLARRRRDGTQSPLQGVPRCADVRLAKTLPKTMLAARD